MKKQIGWVGLGKMGEPMARNVLQAGHDLTVFNRSPDKCSGLRDAGARVAGSINEIASSVDVLFSMLSDDNALRQVALGEGGVIASMRPGAVLVDMSTVSGEVSTELSDAADKGKLAYLRAPVSGSVTLAEAGTLTIMVSGPRASYDSLLPVLEAMSAQQFYVGADDQARYLKLAINLMVGATAALMGEAMALGLKSGLDRSTMLDVISASAVASPLVKYKMDTLKSRDYSPAFEVEQLAKDFDLILDAARNLEAPVPMAAQVREGLDALIAQGDGAADFFKYVELCSARAKVEDAG